MLFLIDPLGLSISAVFTFSVLDAFFCTGGVVVDDPVTEGVACGGGFVIYVAVAAAAADMSRMSSCCTCRFDNDFTIKMTKSRNLNCIRFTAINTDFFPASCFCTCCFFCYRPVSVCMLFLRYRTDCCLINRITLCAVDRFRAFLRARCFLINCILFFPGVTFRSYLFPYLIAAVRTDFFPASCFCTCCFFCYCPVSECMLFLRYHTDCFLIDRITLCAVDRFRAFLHTCCFLVNRILFFPGVAFRRGLFCYLISAVRAHFLLASCFCTRCFFYYCPVSVCVLFLRYHTDCFLIDRITLCAVD